MKLAALALAIAAVLAVPAAAAPLPVCQDLSLSGKHDVELASTLKCAPLDEFHAYVIRTDPKNGKVTLDDQSGAFTYTPRAGFAGTDSFAYTAIDRTAETGGNVATVTVTLTGEAPPPPPPPPVIQPSPQDCPVDVLRLVDVRAKDGHVVLAGETAPEHAGREVTLRFAGRFVAKAKVAADGTFGTQVPLPPREIRHTTRARYRAVLDDLKSPSLKLARRMNFTKLSTRGGKVTIVGRVSKPLADPADTVTLREYTNCRGNRYKVVKRGIEVGPDGRFEVTVPAPANADRAYYRALTKVRKKRANPTTYPTFTLLRGLSL